MLGTIAQWLAGVNDVRTRRNAASPQPHRDRLSTHCLTSAGLTNQTGSSAVVKAGSAFTLLRRGVLVTKTANTDMAALSGTVTNAAFNVYAFFIDSGATSRARWARKSATLAAVVMPRSRWAGRPHHYYIFCGHQPDWHRQLRRRHHAAR